MPAQPDRVSATVNGKNAYGYSISPAQIDVLTPPEAMSGPVQVVVTNGGTASAVFTAPPLSERALALHHMRRSPDCPKRGSFACNGVITANDVLPAVVPGELNHAELVRILS